MGIRPEHRPSSPVATPQSWQLRVEAVEAVKMLGAKRLIYARLQHAQASELLMVRTEETRAAPALGAMIYAAPQAKRLHHFDALTGQRLNIAACAPPQRPTPPVPFGPTRAG